MATINQIRNNLMEALRNQPYTQAELAKKIGVTQSTISHYVSGKKMPALDTLSRLCDVLHLDANEILCLQQKDE